MIQYIRRHLKPLRPESEDLLHLDALRFFAAVGVLILHAWDGFDFNGIPKSPPTTLKLMVDLFFTISGFVIAYVYHDRMNCLADYGVFLKRRIARLGPLHWATLFVFAAVGIAVHSGLPTNFPERYEWSCLVPNALFVHAIGGCQHLSFNGVSWSISAEMGMYIIFPLLLAVMNRGRWLIFAATLFCLFVVSRINEWYYMMSPWGVVRALPSFMVGVTIYSFRIYISKIPFSQHLFLMGIALYVGLTILNASATLLLPLIYFIVAVGTSADARHSAGGFIRYVAPMGQLTYSIYMIHEIFLLAIKDVLAERILNIHGIEKNIMMTIAIVIIFITSYLSLQLFENPARRTITKIKI